MENNPVQSDERRLIQGQVFLIMMLLAFTLVISWRLMAGSLVPTQGFLWMGVCCFVPIAWYSFGYLKSHDKKESNALMITTVGWIFVAMAFLVHYKALLDAGSATQVSDPLITIFLLLGLFILIVGGLFSWQTASQSQLADTTSSQ